MAYGTDSNALKEDRVASAQCLSGTGGLRVAFEFFKHWGPNKEKTNIIVPQPTWGNHNSITKYAGLTVSTYRYYNPKRIEADVEAMLQDLDKAKSGDVVLLHSCAHNPTGCDISDEDWRKIEEVIASKKLVPLFDTAYQGFATGDLDRDAASIRLFESKGHNLITIQSFAKNLGL